MVESVKTQQRDTLLGGLIVLGEGDFFKSTDSNSDECAQIKNEMREASRTLFDDVGKFGFNEDGLMTKLFQNTMRDLVSRYNEKCRGDVRTAQQPESTGNHFEILLPESLNPTVAAVGAEGVYGASTLTPWEAAIVREAKAVGQSAKGLAMPVLVLGLLALGALQAVETGNTSTIQRAWAMVR